jgi:hypothetical protein
MVVIDAIDDSDRTYAKRPVTAERPRQWLSQIWFGCEAIERSIDPFEESAVAPREPLIALSGVAGKPKLHDR